MDFIYTIKKLLLYNLPTTIFALACIWPACGFLPNLPSILVYGIPLLYSVYCLGKRQTIDKSLLILVAYIPIELIIAQPSSVFKSWPRFIFFLILLCNVSPLLNSDTLREYRERIFRISMYACVFLGVGSFFARFLGINYMVLNDDFIAFGTGIFGGLTPQSMLLGPIAGVAACYLSYLAYKTKKKWLWAWVIMAFGAVLFSASRSALLAAVVGIVITIYRLSGTVSKFFRISVVTIVLAVTTFSFWGSALDNVIEKNGSVQVLNISSRENIWYERLDDFKSSPIIGVGFCAAADENAYGVDKATGRFESGSSWIIILSMLGIIGAGIVVPAFFKAFITAFSTQTEYSALSCGILSLFFIHMFAEGYVFAGGSFLAFLLWLSIGIAMDCKYKQAL